MSPPINASYSPQLQSILFLTKSFFCPLIFSGLLGYRIINICSILLKRRQVKTYTPTRCLIETTGSFLPTMLNVFIFSWCCFVNKHSRYSLNIYITDYTEHHGRSMVTSPVLFQPTTFVACHAPLMLHFRSASAAQERRNARKNQSTICCMCKLFCFHGLQLKCNMRCGYCMCMPLLLPVI